LFSRPAAHVNCRIREASTLRRRDMPMEPTSPDHAHDISVDSRLEELGLSVRTRNALRGVGCDTIADLLRLDIDTPVRGLGKIAREDLLANLDRAGSPPPPEPQPAPETPRIERTLERMHHRVDPPPGALSKETRAPRQRPRRLRPRPPQTSDPSGAG